MRIVVVGATGTIGSAVAAELGERHEVIGVTRRGRPAVDLAELDTIPALFADVPDVDAVVCCAPNVPLTPLADIDPERPSDIPSAKLFGQIAMVRAAADHLRDGGSVTVTSGAFMKPTPGSALGSMANAGLDAFVRAGAPEMPRGLRMNAVGPGWVRESLVAMGMEPGDGTPAADVAAVYASAVEGSATGSVLSVS